MDRNQGRKPSVLSAMILIIIAFILIVAVFYLSGNGTDSPIVLPDNLSDQTQKPNDEISTPDNFLQVTAENVQSVVATIHRPVSYHQVCTVTITQGERTISQSIDIWVDGHLLRADVSSETGTASVLTDGSIAYLWHSEEDGYSSVALNNTVSVDDMLGLPTYELLLNADPATLVEASYLLLSDENTQCIYVSASSKDSLSEAYWIDISSGLLYRADFSSDGTTVYEMQQTALERLAAGDEAFSDCFMLPDGIRAFSGE